MEGYRRCRSAISALPPPPPAAAPPPPLPSVPVEWWWWWLSSIVPAVMSSISAARQRSPGCARVYWSQFVPVSTWVNFCHAFSSEPYSVLSVSLCVCLFCCQSLCIPVCFTLQIPELTSVMLSTSRSSCDSVTVSLFPPRCIIFWTSQPFVIKLGMVIKCIILSWSVMQKQLKKDVLLY